MRPSYLLYSFQLTNALYSIVMSLESYWNGILGLFVAITICISILLLLWALSPFLPPFFGGWYRCSASTMFSTTIRNQFNILYFDTEIWGGSIFLGRMFWLLVSSLRLSKNFQFPALVPLVEKYSFFVSDRMNLRWRSVFAASLFGSYNYI